MSSPAPASIARAASAVRRAEAVFIGAGAGMGVDSGLPDFRGDDGFWQAYPPFARLGLSFTELANPQWFNRDPELAWGFYGHRLHLYRKVKPHAGFAVLLAWARAKPHGAFVFTSNVDGQFQRAGFDPRGVLECHGSIHNLQCATPCSDQIWSATACQVQVDPDTMRARPPLPRCPHCGGMARPNILMFGDYTWQPQRTQAQEEALADWLDGISERPLAVIELGAGLAVPTVRWTCERMARAHRDAVLIRINPREAQGPSDTISMPGPALQTLQDIAAAV